MYFYLMQQGGQHPNSTSQTEVFHQPHREPVSGFLVYPPQNQSHVREMENNFSGNIYRRPSHSGPLVPGIQLGRGGKEVDDGPLGSNRVNLSKLSGLVASRTSAPEDHREERRISLLPRKTFEVKKSVESTNNVSDSRRHDRKRHSPRIVDLTHLENARGSTQELTPVRLSLISCFILFTWSIFGSEGHYFVLLFYSVASIISLNPYIYVRVLLNSCGFPYFREAVVTWKTRSISLVHC